MDDFPFGIMQVASLLDLRIRRRQSDSVYTDCPICGDRRGKMNLHLRKNVFRCNYCGEGGGMIMASAGPNEFVASTVINETFEYSRKKYARHSL